MELTRQLADEPDNRAQQHLEQVLVERARQNFAAGHANEAFAELYRCHLDRVYRYILMRVGNRADAQDLTSQTFLAALENLSNYRSRGNFAAWLLGIARHKVIDHFREQPQAVSLEMVEHIIHTDSPLDELTPTLEIDHVTTALRTISPERAEAVTLYIFGELTSAEVGQVMHRSRAAAKMLINRGLRDLRQRLLRIYTE